MNFATEPFAAFEDVVQQYDGVLATADHDRVTGLLRRAARSLRGLVGDLTQYEAGLVTDTLVDAVIRRLDNPRGFASETDGDYSYRYFKGSDGFWWPGDWANTPTRCGRSGCPRCRRRSISARSSDVSRRPGLVV